MADTRAGSDPAASIRRPARRRPWGLLAGIVALALLITSQSLLAGQIYNVSVQYPGIDKVAHVVQYALVFLAVWWLVGDLVERRATRIALAAGTALLLGLGDELFQRHVAARTFAVADLAANVVGVALGIGVRRTRP